jgi:hypothetical protein
MDAQRANGAQLRNYIGRNVRIVGRIASEPDAEGRFQLTASDSVVIAVTRQFGSDAPERDSIVEVVGKVVDERYVDAFNMYYMPNLGVLRLL